MCLVPHAQLLVLLVQEPPVQRRLADIGRELRQRFDPPISVRVEEEGEGVPVRGLPHHPLSCAACMASPMLTMMLPSRGSAGTQWPSLRTSRPPTSSCKMRVMQLASSCSLKPMLVLSSAAAGK
ncbi:hypothetical protein ZEAMMB73_Zm00001d002101 [Zea mays]|uniref:Uncharacterized protein n=1 Tax=Zea mays TaxID=4577 RepID=A0A1D6DWK8_MAIZE|nr:hypothetical protein ZEAMMB73_Zm00001d002101 [Zea mays]